MNKTITELLGAVIHELPNSTQVQDNQAINTFTLDGHHYSKIAINPNLSNEERHTARIKATACSLAITVIEVAATVKYP